MFVQRGIRALKLGQMSVCVSLCIDTGVLLTGDGVQESQCLVPAKMTWCQVRNWIMGILGNFKNFTTLIWDVDEG